MTIAEVGKKFELTPDTLRYYERIGLLPNVRRSSGRIRNYSDEDCRWIEFIKCMRAAGVQIEALTEYVRLFHQGDETRDARLAILVDQREQLLARMAEMQKTLDRLNFKIDHYHSTLKKCENELKE